MPTLKEQMMRYTPAALALALLAAVTSSVSQGAPVQPLDPRAARLVAEGRAALASGQTDLAIDAFEAAMAIQPGHVTIILNLAEASRSQGLQGKALHYYREVLESDPDNRSAISGEGMALVEKGAVEKARRNLARLEMLCGTPACPPAADLAAAIAKGPPKQMVSAEPLQAQPVVTKN